MRRFLPRRPEPPVPSSKEQIDPREEFSGRHYLRHNRRRQEHLATLGLQLAGRSVIEVGAGIGDHTEFFLDRECSVLTSEGRPENVQILRDRFPYIAVRWLDLDDPDPDFHESAEVVYCYGTLYHLSRPERALEFMADACTDLLLVETCVSFGEGQELNPVDEPVEHPSQSLSGRGCRPTRAWVFDRLGSLFPFVYVPRTQP
jgi:hypothetical protein